MRRPRTILLSAALGLAALALAATAAGSGPRTAWTRVSGPTAPGVQLGLARTADGVLHAIWNRGATNTSILETRFSAAGKALGTSSVASGWAANNGLALVVMPDKSLQLFASGTNGIHAFTAPPAGRSWTPQAVAPWGGPVAEASAAYRRDRRKPRRGEDPSRRRRAPVEPRPRVDPLPCR